MAWQRRRRHNDGFFYWDSNRFIPKSWGVHEGPMTYNVTRRRGSIRLPLGLGSWTFGKGASRRRRSGTGCLGYVLIALLVVLVTAALLVGLYVVPAVTTWLHSVSAHFGR